MDLAAQHEELSYGLGSPHGHRSPTFSAKDLRPPRKRTCTEGGATPSSLAVGDLVMATIRYKAAALLSVKAQFRRRTPRVGPIRGRISLQRR